MSGVRLQQGTSYDLVGPMSEGLSNDPSFAPTPTVAAVVPLFGREDYIEHCLASIAAQEESFDRVVLVDDANESRSLDSLIAKKLAADRRWGVVVMPEPVGIVRATREGIASAQEDYIAMVDCDDELTPNAAGEIRKVLRSARPLLISTGYESFRDGDSTETNSNLTLLRVYESDLLLALEHTFLSHLKVGRRDFLLAAGLPLGTDGVQDWFMGLAAVEAKSYFVLPQVLYRHRIHADQTSHSSKDHFMKVVNDRRAEVISAKRSLSAATQLEMGRLVKLMSRHVEDIRALGALLVGRDDNGLFAVPGSLSWMELVLHERRPAWMMIVSDQWLDVGAMPLEQLRGKTVLGLMAAADMPASMEMAIWYSGYLDGVFPTSTVARAYLAPYLAASTRLIGPSR